MNAADLRAFFSTAFYEDMIKELRKLTSFELQEPKDTTIEIISLSGNVKMSINANLSIKEIEECITNHQQELLQYLLKKQLLMWLSIFLLKKERLSM